MRGGEYGAEPECQGDQGEEMKHHRSYILKKSGQNCVKESTRRGGGNAQSSDVLVAADTGASLPGRVDKFS